jgi:hypothetical protein
MYLSSHTGRIQVEGKSVMNYVIGERMNQGLSQSQAAFGIDDHLAELGPWLSPNRFVAESTLKVPPREMVSYWFSTAWRNRKTLSEWLFVYPAFGSFLMLSLAAVGFVRRPWSYQQLITETVLISVVILHVAILLGMPFVDLRFLLPLLPFLIIWTARGISEFADWVRASAQQMGALRRPTINWLGIVAVCILIAGFDLLAVRASPARSRSDAHELALRDAGQWISAHVGRDRRIMTTFPEVAYYAGGVLLPLPEAEEPLAIKYARLKAPDLLVVAHETERAGYQENWFSAAPSDATLLRTVGSGSAQVAIYQWNGRPGPSE